MTNTRITYDNTQLSPPNQQPAALHDDQLVRDLRQPNARTPQITTSVDTYLRASGAENTRRAYRSDVEHFLRWGAQIPASPETVAEYIAHHAEQLSPFTLARRLVALAQAHKFAEFENPCSSQLVKATIRGIRRVRGLAQRQADPILREDLLLMLDLLPNSTRGIRDRALLLVGFCGAFRRGEIAAMRFDDVRFVPEGLTICLPRSKTDQEGKGRLIAIPWGRSKACAVRSLKAWIDHAGIGSGAIFRRINKGGKVLSDRVCGSSVAQIIKEHAACAGLNVEKISGHSLRAGLVTSAAKSGVSSWKIRQQTGHKSDAMLERYIRDSDLFNNNAASAVL